MRRTGTDLMATGVIAGSTALAVAATLAFARANPVETQDATAGCTPLEAHWAVSYAVTVDGAGVTSTPYTLRWHKGVQGPEALHQATGHCRHLTIVAPRMKLTADRLAIELGEAAERAATAGERAEVAKEQAEAVRERLEAIKDYAEQQRRLREALAEQLRENGAGER